MASDINTPLVKYLSKKDLEKISLDKSLLYQTRLVAKRELKLRYK